LANTSGSIVVGAGTNNSLVLGNATSAEITLSGGTGASDSITAPVKLESNLIIDGTSGGTLTLGNISQANAGTGLTLNNPDATLVLTGSDTYSGTTSDEAGKMIATNVNAIKSGTNLDVGTQSAFDTILPAGGNITAVPEPSTLALLAFGGVAAAWGAMRRRFGRNR
jgi:hypothetical protein